MSDPTSITPWIPVISALGGVLATGLITYLLNRTNKKSEEKKHLQTLLINTAVEDHKQACLVAQGQAERGSKVIIAPLDNYIINMLKLAELLNQKEVTPEKVIANIKETDKVLKAANNAIKELESKKQSK